MPSLIDYDVTREIREIEDHDIWSLAEYKKRHQDDVEEVI